MRHFVVKDKNGNVISAVAEQDAEGKDHVVTISVVIPGGTKEAIDQDEYDKQTKIKAE